MVAFKCIAYCMFILLKSKVGCRRVLIGLLEMLEGVSKCLRWERHVSSLYCDRG